MNPKIMVVFALVTLILSQSVAEHRGLRSVFGAIFDYHPASHLTNENNPTENSNDIVKDTEEPPLPQTAKASLTEKQFTALRIEYIKNQILKKLRLKHKPTISFANLPMPVKEYDNLIPDRDDHLQSSYSDDFYGKTTQAILFPYEDQARCLRKIRFPSVCVPFQMPTDLHISDVSMAELWFHKVPDNLDPHNQTFVVSEVAHWDTNKSFQKTKPIAIQETSLTEGWLKVDLTYVVKNWLDFQDSPTHAINVVCKTCGMDKNQSPISFSSDLKPFLVIYTHSQQRRPQHRRNKRQANCEAGVNECCRESLYVSFSEIGWDDWIIKPEGYNAYFCKGSCVTASALTLSATQHNSILQKVMYGQNRNRGSRPELTPCCAATQFQALQLVYMDNNKTLTTKVLSNMIVDSCGCM